MFFDSNHSEIFYFRSAEATLKSSPISSRHGNEIKNKSKTIQKLNTSSGHFVPFPGEWQHMIGALFQFIEW